MQPTSRISRAGALAAALVLAAAFAPAAGAAAVPSKPSDARPLELAIGIDGPAIKVAPSQAGSPVRLLFHAKAGQRVNLGLLAVHMTPASKSALLISVRDSRDQLLSGERMHCFAADPPRTDGNCDAEFTIAQDGRHVIEIDAPFSARASYSAQLSTPASVALVPGQRHRVNLARVGRDARFSVATSAGADLSVIVRSAEPGQSGFHLKVFHADGKALAAARGTPDRGASVPLPGDGGTYVAEVDPDHGAAGSFLVEVRAAPKLEVGGEPVGFSSDGAPLTRVGLEYRKGHPFTVTIEALAHAPDVESNSVLRILKSDGQPVIFQSCATRPLYGRDPMPCKVLVADVAQGAPYAIGISAPSRANVSGRLVAVETVNGTIEQGVPVSVPPLKPTQVAQYTLEAAAGQKFVVELSDFSSTPAGNAVRVTVKAEGSPIPINLFGREVMRMASPFVVQKPGRLVVTIDPGHGTFGGGRLSVAFAPEGSK